MDRRRALRKLFFSDNTTKILMAEEVSSKVLLNSVDWNIPHRYTSHWQLLTNGTWIGEDLWSQHSADWRIQNGELQCVHHRVESILFVRTHRLAETTEIFKATVILQFLDKPKDEAGKQNYAGFRMGIKADFVTYDSAITTEKGIDIGITRDGYLFIGRKIDNKPIAEEILTTEVRLVLSVIPQLCGKHFARVKALDKSGNTLVILSDELEATVWIGDIGLVSHYKPETYAADEPTVAFRYLQLEGGGLINHVKLQSNTQYF